MFEFAGFRLDLRTRRLLRGAETVPVTAKAFDTLAWLVERAGHVVDKDELMRRVWPDAVVEEANLSQQIFVLRKALGEGPKDHRFIATVPRRGYRFVADVQCVDETKTAAAAAPADEAGVSARSARDLPPLHLSLLLSPGPPMASSPCAPFALSPDGAALVYVACDGPTTMLQVRRLDRLDVTRLPRTHGASAPFFSPDSRWIGYFAAGRLLKVPVNGGAPVDLCEAGAECRGASWSSRGEIVFAPTPASGLVRVPEDGGHPRPATTLGFADGERTHRWPEVLPGGRDVIFTVARAGAASFDHAEIAIASLESGERRTVQKHGSFARYAPSGHLVYMRGGSIMAAGFDLQRREVCGGAMPVVDQVMTQPTGAGYFAFSHDGCLIYVTGEAHAIEQQLVWASSDGPPAPLPIIERLIEEPRLSPDGTRVALGIRRATSDIWVHDFGRGALTRVTFDGDNFAPVWTPDGARLTFSSNRRGPCHIFSQRVAEDAEPIALVGGDYDLVPGSWSADGAVLLFTEYNPQTGAGIWALDAATGSAPRQIVRSRSNAFAPAFAPGGRSFAYTSDESGRCEIFLAAFPDGRRLAQVSVDGGAEPVWSADGRRLYYRSGASLLMAEIEKTDASHASAPVRVIDGPYQAGAMTGLPNYDVARDGRLLLVAQRAAAAHPDRLSATVRWFTEIVHRLA